MMAPGSFSFTQLLFRVGRFDRYHGFKVMCKDLVQRGADKTLKNRFVLRTNKCTRIASRPRTTNNTPTPMQKKKKERNKAFVLTVVVAVPCSLSVVRCRDMTRWGETPYRCAMAKKHFNIVGILKP